MFLKSPGDPEIPMIGVQALSELCMWSTTSRPSTPGIRMSVMTRSNRPLSNFWIPSWPSEAISTLKPAFDNAILMIFNIDISSSMTKIWYMKSPNLFSEGEIPPFFVLSALIDEAVILWWFHRMKPKCASDLCFKEIITTTSSSHTGGPIASFISSFFCLYRHWQGWLKYKSKRIPRSLLKRSRNFIKARLKRTSIQV